MISMREFANRKIRERVCHPPIPAPQLTGQFLATGDRA
jgi:hypothetical protein